jgi:hypothetical protein
MPQLIYAIEHGDKGGCIVAVAEKEAFDATGRRPKYVKLPSGMGRRFRYYSGNRFQFNGDVAEAHERLHGFGLIPDDRLLTAKPPSHYQIRYYGPGSVYWQEHRGHTAVVYGDGTDPSHREWIVFTDLVPARYPAMFKDDAPAWGLVPALIPEKRPAFVEYLKRNPSVVTVRDCRVRAVDLQAAVSAIVEDDAPLDSVSIEDAHALWCLGDFKKHFEKDAA